MKKGSIATNDLEAVKDLLLDDIKDIIRNRDDKSGLEKQQKLTKKVRRLFIGAFDDEEQAQIRRGMGMGETPQLETDKDKFVRGRGMRSARPGQVQRSTIHRYNNLSVDSKPILVFR